MILNEEIYGNMATVYHRSRTKPDEFDKLLKNNLWKSGSAAGNLYGLGLYTVFSLSSNKKSYGDYVYKFHVKGIKDFYIFLPDVYNKVWNTNLDYDEIVAEQNKRFNIKVESYKSFVGSGSRLHSKVKGIVFHGNNDGDVCIVFEPRNAIPVAWSSNVSDGKYLPNKQKIKWNDFEKDYGYNKKAMKSGIEDYFSPVKKEIQKAEVGDFIDCGDGFKLKRLKISIGKLFKLDDKDRENRDEKSSNNKWEAISLMEKYFDSKNFFNDKYDAFAYSVYENGEYYGVGVVDLVSNKAIKKIPLLCKGDDKIRDLPMVVRDKIKELYEPHDRDRAYKNSYRNSGEYSFKERNGLSSYLKYDKILPSFLSFVSLDTNNNIIAHNPYGVSGKLNMRICYPNGNDELEEIERESGLTADEFMSIGSDDKLRVIMSLPDGEVSVKGKNPLLKKFLPYVDKKLKDMGVKKEMIKYLNSVYNNRRNEKLKRVNDKEFGLMYNMANTKDNKMKARLSIEKKRREAEGKYIGRNQYADLREEVDYFGY